MNDRIKKLRLILSQNGLDAILISNFFNILYLTGFKTLSPTEREAWLLITKNDAYLFTDGRYYEKNEKLKFKNQKLKIKLITASKSLLQYLNKIVIDEKIIKLGFEADDLKYTEYQRIKLEMQNFVSLQLIPTEKLIIKQREIKEDEEIDKIKKACLITNQCLKEIIKTIKTNQTEKEIAFKIEYWLKNRGYDLAFFPIVAIDENTSLPHYDTKNNGQKKIKKNSVILIDFGVHYQNYLSDITRMVFINRPKPEKINQYQLLLDAQQKTIERLKKENRAKEIDLFCRQLIQPFLTQSTKSTNSKQIKPTYPHSTGHGLGLEIHEFPKISSSSKDLIKKNQVFTIEPGIYFPGKFGLRIEDTIWMKEEKNPQVITKFAKNMIVISV